MALDLGESWPAWHPDVRRASWTAQGVEQDVLVVLAAHTPGAVGHARTEAVAAKARRGKHILPLLGVEPTGRHVAWVYPFEVVIALGQLPESALGPRAAAGVVRDVTRTLLDVDHPGPCMDHVLLDAAGTVRLANFVGPLACGDAWKAPGVFPVPRADQVFRLGLLLCELLGSEAEQSIAALEHEAFIHGVLMNAMSAPGAPLDESYRELIRDLLAWDPRDRPTLVQALARLEDLVERTGGATLHDTAASAFSGWMIPHRGGGGMDISELQDFSGAEFETLEVSNHRTLDGEEVLGDLEDTDDPTVDSELGIVPITERTPVSSIEFGSLPLRVGPPPEAVKPTPRLPPGFMGSSETTSTVVAPEASGTPRWLMWLGVSLLGMAVGMACWLVLG